MTRISESRRSAILPRARLDGLLDDVLQRRLTTVVAGPGFGKSTLLNTWARAHRSAWCELRPGDDQLDRFARALGACVSGLTGEDVRVTDGGDDDEESADAIATGLSEALHGTAHDDVILVIDDVHEIPAGSSAARALEGFVRQAPSHVHFVFGSRVPPPFPIERMRGHGEVVVVGAADLAFTRDEIGDVLGARGLNPDLADAVLVSAAGWPAVTILVIDALARTPEHEQASAIASLAEVDGPAFSYIADEVLASESPDVRALLRVVAQLERFTPRLCAALGFARAHDIVSDLARRGVMLERASRDGWFRVHMLARTFFAERMPLSDEERRDVQRSAALWLEQEGWVEDALQLAMSADDVELIIGLIERNGASLIERGASTVVLEAVERIPLDRQGDASRLIAARARLDIGDERGAVVLLDQIVGEEGDVRPEVGSLLAEAYVRQEDVPRLRAILDRVRIEEATRRDRAILLHAQARIAYREERIEDSLALTRAAGEAADACGAIPTLVASLGLEQGLLRDLGEYDEARIVVQRAIEAGKRARNPAFFEQMRHHLAMESDHDGRTLEGLEHADAGVRALETWYPHSLGRRGIALTIRGLLLVKVGRLDEGLRDLLSSKDLCRRHRPPYLPMILNELGVAYALRGDLALARAQYEEAMRMSKQAELLHESLDAEMGIASLEIHTEPEVAVARSRRVMTAFEGEHIHASLTAGWIELIAGDRDVARAYAQAALEHGRAGQIPSTIAASLELLAMTAAAPDIAALEEARSLWAEMGMVPAASSVSLAIARLSGDPEAEARAMGMLDEIGVATQGLTRAGLIAALPVVARGAVEVRTLGTFVVIVDGETVSGSAWPSKKARDLFRILLARRGAPTHREVLMNLLWPEQDPASLSNRFSVALSGVRTMLDPASKRPQDHFVAADVSSVALQMAHLRVDVEEFLRIAEAALDAPGVDDAPLARAESMYAGDFLEEDIYEEWATTLRERARIVFVAVENTLARAAAARGDHAGAARRFLRIIERDPYDEAAHLGLVRASAAAGHHGEARRQYRAYVVRMRELDIEPAAYPSTR